MRRVELKDIRNFACQGANLVVEPGELLVLLGPNGAGKTTLLNVIAGLVAYQGQVLFDDEPVDDLPARARQVGYVFQDLNLFPHLDVATNISYGLQATGLTEPERDDRVQELLSLLAISHLATRFPNKLSGGERQRVALARALAPRPKILLLDEPFGSLDERTSGFLRAELRHLQRELGTTTVFVTHDLVEAEQIADRMIVVQDGVISRTGTFEQVLFEGRQGEASEVNVLKGTLQEIAQVAGAIRVKVEVAGHLIAAELPRGSCESSRLEPGAPVLVELGLTKLRVMTDGQAP